MNKELYFPNSVHPDVVLAGFMASSVASGMSPVDSEVVAPEGNVAVRLNGLAGVPKAVNVVHAFSQVIRDANWHISTDASAAPTSARILPFEDAVWRSRLYTDFGSSLKFVRISASFAMLLSNVETDQVELPENSKRGNGAADTDKIGTAQQGPRPFFSTPLVTATSCTVSTTSQSLTAEAIHSIATLLNAPSAKAIRNSTGVFPSAAAINHLALRFGSLMDDDPTGAFEKEQTKKYGSLKQHSRLQAAASALAGVADTESEPASSDQQGTLARPRGGTGTHFSSSSQQQALTDEGHNKAERSPAKAGRSLTVTSNQEYIAAYSDAARKRSETNAIETHRNYVAALSAHTSEMRKLIEASLPPVRDPLYLDGDKELTLAAKRRMALKIGDQSLLDAIQKSEAEIAAAAEAQRKQGEQTRQRFITAWHDSVLITEVPSLAQTARTLGLTQEEDRPGRSSSTSPARRMEFGKPTLNTFVHALSNSTSLALEEQEAAERKRREKEEWSAKLVVEDPYFHKHLTSGTGTNDRVVHAGLIDKYLPLNQTIARSKEARISALKSVLNPVPLERELDRDRGRSQAIGKSEEPRLKFIPSGSMSLQTSGLGAVYRRAKKTADIPSSFETPRGLQNNSGAVPASYV